MRRGALKKYQIVTRLFQGALWESHRMRSLLTLTAILTLLMLVSSASTAAVDMSTPAGRWIIIDEKSGYQAGVIDIAEIGGEFEGKILKLLPHPGGIKAKDPVCAQCPGDLKNRPLIGMKIMSGLKKDGDAWDGGSILDTDSGDSYSVILRLADGGRKLVVRGYIGISLIGRSQTWIRDTNP
jgi:uncharacterized protein (DUF2147 family)